MLFDWKGGIAQDYCYELYGNENTAAVSYTHSRSGRDFSQRVWFSAEELTPRHAEVYSDGQMIASFDFLIFSLE